MAIRTAPKASSSQPRQMSADERAYYERLTLDMHAKATEAVAKLPRKGRPASGKQVVSLRLDPDIIAAFRATGPGWQARINEALRRQMP